jgi:hypothetical protein
LLRSSLRALFFFAVAIPFADLSACSSDSSTTTSELNPPRLRVDSIASAGGVPWTRSETDGCIRPGNDPNRTLSVNIGPLDTAGHLVSPGSQPISWTLAPPGSCSGTPPCGYLILSVCASGVSNCNSRTPASSGVQQIIAAGPSIPVRMSGFATPTGSFTFHVELWDEDTTPFNDVNGDLQPSSGQQLSAGEAVVQVTDDCVGRPIPTDSGAPPPPTDGGSPDTGPSIPVDSSTPLPDATTPDATLPDTGAPPPDAHPPDATTPVDARPPPDATPPPTDSGPVPPTDAHTGG